MTQRGVNSSTDEKVVKRQYESMPSSKKMSLREAKAYARSLKDNEAFKIYMQR